MVKSHLKHWQQMQKLYCGRGLSLHVCFTSETDIWVQIGRGKVGLLGNIQVKSYIPKSKFDVFDIRKSHRLYIHNVRKIHMLGFSVQRVWGKSLKISRSVSYWSLIFKIMIGGCL